MCIRCFYKYVLSVVFESRQVGVDWTLVIYQYRIFIMTSVCFIILYTVMRVLAQSLFRLTIVHCKRHALIPISELRSQPINISEVPEWRNKGDSFNVLKYIVYCNMSVVHLFIITFCSHGECIYSSLLLYTMSMQLIQYVYSVGCLLIEKNDKILLLCDYFH